jgi:glycosyltransferase involved in cell wall biosynthesis
MRSLYICYFNTEEPLVHTQVLPYLRAIARAGVETHLLTYERRGVWRAGERQRRRELKQQLKADGIRWHALKYHRRPSLAATAYDVWLGVLYAAWLVMRHRIHVLHARAHIPGVIALPLKMLLRRKLIFDLRGLMAEEYVDNGRWADGGLPFRLIKSAEGTLIHRADRMVVLTEALKAALLGTADPAICAERIFVIPCCADLSRYDEAAARASKTPGSFTMVYAGSTTGRYLLHDMIAFFKAVQRRRPEARFLVLTRNDHAEVKRAFAASGVAPACYSLLAVEPAKVPALLCAADAAINFVKPSKAVLASSPTKTGEYLAAGLPVVSTSGGDTDAILLGENVGVIVSGLTAQGYEQAAARLLDLLEQTSAGRCRAAARKFFSLDEVGGPRYVALYHSLQIEMPASAEPVSVAYER